MTEELKIADIIKITLKRKQQKDKAALIAAKKILKNYKNIRFRLWMKTRKKLRDQISVN